MHPSPATAATAKQVLACIHVSDYVLAVAVELEEPLAGSAASPPFCVFMGAWREVSHTAPGTEFKTQTRAAGRSPGHFLPGREQQEPARDSCGLSPLLTGTRRVRTGESIGAGVREGDAHGARGALPRGALIPSRGDSVGPLAAGPRMLRWG